jgi:GxxExxY protein
MTDNELTERIIGAAIDVHRELGPGLVEAVYEEAMCHELHLRRLAFERQNRVPLRYKNVSLSVSLRLDLVVEGRIIVELQAKDAVAPIDRVKLLSYLRLTDRQLGLIINFHIERLVDGVSRVVNRLVEPLNPPEPPDLLS